MNPLRSRGRIAGKDCPRQAGNKGLAPEKEGADRPAAGVDPLLCSCIMVCIDKSSKSFDHGRSDE